MKRGSRYSKFESLSSENRKEAVRLVDDFLKENGIDSEERARHKMLLGMILLEYSDYDKDAPFRILTQRRYKKVQIMLAVSCARMNLMENADSLLGRELLGQLADPPKWSYRFGWNRLMYTTKTLVPDKDAVKSLLHYMAKEKKTFRTGIILRFVNMLLLVVEPLLAARIITSFSEGDLTKILVLAITMGGLNAASSLVTYIASRKLTRAYTTMRDEMQTALAKSVLEIKTENIDSHSSGVFIERIMEETGNIVLGLDKMLQVVTEAFRLIALMVAFFIVSPVMLLFELVLFFFYFLIVLKQEKKLNSDNRSVKNARENLNGIITEMVKATRDIKLLHCENSFTAKAKSYVSDHTQKVQDMENHTNGYIFARTQFVAWSNVAYMGMLVLLMWKYGMQPATALVLYNYNGKTYASGRAVSTATEAIYSLSLAAERVYALLKSRDFEKEEWGSKRLETVRGDIVLQDVYFNYRNEEDTDLPLLRGVNLHIRPGESVALVGKSGCGKSSILSLLTRLYVPLKGNIRFDGIDLAMLDKDSIRGKIGMVSQMPYIFNMSIRENFAIVKEDVTEEEMIKACQTACIHDDIMQFSLGYDTVAGEGGVMLSGGQRQRIALARCLIQDYPIIVLDEATSALDNNTQEKIREAIESLHDRTVIMVAHRLSTVIGCDRLYFIENGKVLAEGTHKELLENCEAYRELYGADCIPEQGTAVE